MNQPVRAPTPHDPALTSLRVRRFVPRVVGIRVTKDITYYHRWHMTYPRKPNTVVCSFSQGGDLAAMRAGLKGLWAMHTEEHPEAECPYDLDDIDPRIDPESTRAAQTFSSQTG